MPGSEQVLVLSPVGEATGHVPFFEGLGIAHPTVEEMIGVGEAAHDCTDQDELANQAGILKCEVDGQFAPMGTADKNRVTHFLMAQECGEILCFGIPSGCSGRAAITAAVVANGVEPFAENGPDIVPHRGMSDPVVDKSHDFGAGAALFVVELGAFDLYK